MNFKLAPSILAADLMHLEDEIRSIERGGAEYLHFDVMDGHFVSNISFGLPLIESIRPGTNLTLDAHLMVEEPLKFTEFFSNAGADIITVHCETENAESCLKQIRLLGKKPSVAVNPGTPVKDIIPLIEIADMVLLMAVEPGMGGRKFIPGVLRKAEALAGYIAANNLICDIEMDGGINLSNLTSVLSAGVNVVVAGSAIFERGKTEENTRKFVSFTPES